jgi:hypothetical protein
MDWNALFGLSSTAALAGWVGLLVLPRWGILLRGLQFGLIGTFCVLYAGIVFATFFQVPGGGFSSIAAVQALFASPAMVVAGWVHYLAFDLFVGIWIARQADAAGIGRILQVPLLLATFLFGPLGLLLYYGTRAPLAGAPALTPRVSP